MSQASALEAVLGEQVQRLRIDRQWRQEDLATAMLEVAGVNWTRNVVAAVESGKRQLTTSELLLVAHVLRCSLLELMGDSEVTLADVRVKSRGGMRWLLCGQGIPDDVVSRPTSLRQKPIFILKEPISVYERLWGSISWKRREEAFKAALDPLERRFATKMNVKVRVISMAAFHLWGRSLTDESDARVSVILAKNPSLPDREAKRRANRELYEQVEAELNARFAATGLGQQCKTTDEDL